MSRSQSLALLEVANLTPALFAVDCCLKAANVRLQGVESTDGADQCIRLIGSDAEVRQAGEQGLAAALRMGTEARLTILSAPLDETAAVADLPPVYSPLLGLYDHRKPGETGMAQTDAIGLLETQGLVAALHATDDMLKSSNVTLLGKEKIGAAYVTIVISGDVAAVQTAIATGKQTIERLGGTLIMADTIARPHAELAALLPVMPK
ncbi:MAG: BMC domain-containing protein [Planctomycetaceae bacterium]|nr:BMC domain-containing protein [Planctomycetaceae bacterium]